MTTSTSCVRVRGCVLHLSTGLLVSLGVAMPSHAQPQGSRVVVFEGFYRPT